MKYLKRKIAVLLALLMTIVTIQIPRASENRDYLDITMADIIVAWYNASGVAIGYTSILNGIYSVYGNDTLRNLVNNGIIKSTATNDKEEIQQLIGYGNLTAPTVYVDMSAFRTWFNNHPTTGDVKESLEAMFSSLGGDTGGIQGLATVLGMVANLGKIPYSFEPNTGAIVTSENVTNVTSLKNVYNNFVQTNYFIQLVQENETSNEYIWLNNLKAYQNNVQIIPPPYTYNEKNNLLIGIVAKGYDLNDIFAYGKILFDYTKYGYGIIRYPTGTRAMLVNMDKSTTDIEYYEVGINWRNGQKHEVNLQIQQNTQINKLSTNGNYYALINGYSSSIYPDAYGCVLKFDTQGSHELNAQYIIDNWKGASSGTTSGDTDYINKDVGNINGENYEGLNPNIGPYENMYIFERGSYQQIVDTINENTNNGQYTENGDIINNYNNTYIQDTSTPNVRPSLPPTSGELPAQPFITPRPDLPIEEVEDIIYGGNVPGEIEKKFPFCIPWDVKACVDYFWSPTRKAPHIHWNATFGEWGSLGEIDVDLTPYNTVATVHRALMLIAWIVGLAILTPKILP